MCLQDLGPRSPSFCVRVPKPDYLDIEIDAEASQKDSGIFTGDLVAYTPRHRILLGRGVHRAMSDFELPATQGGREPAVRVWLILWKAAHAIEKNAMQSISALGLGLSDFAVLEVLLHKGPLPVNTIGRQILLTSSSITAAIDRLEARKLLRRVTTPKDKRSRIVELTEPGRRLIERGFQKHASDMEETMAVLKTNERAELVRLLKKVGLWAAARLDDRS